MRFSAICCAFVLLGFLVPVPAVADLKVKCSDCAPREQYVTPDLITRASAGVGATLVWSTAQDPRVEEHEILLYAGNPMPTDAIPVAATLDFQQVNGSWQASWTCSPEELDGVDVFLTVVTRKAPNGEETILDWRSWRVLVARATPPPSGPGSAWELTIFPEFLQITNGRRELPRTGEANRRAWWPIATTERQFGDLDLDGTVNGAPGLGIHYTEPWPAGVGERGWKDQVMDFIRKFDRLGGRDHRVGFDDLQWTEQPDREIPAGPDGEPLVVKHYYTLITVFTKADYDPLEGSQVGGSGRKRFYGHETSARLKSTDDPQFWASYSRRDYGADPHLLELMRKQVRDTGRIPGMGRIEKDPGDGGPTTYRVGWQVRIDHWPGGNENDRAGFIATDVVAARAGYGALISQDRNQAMQEALCKVLRCDEVESKVNLSDPPGGYKVAAPSAMLLTKTGSLAFWPGVPKQGLRKVGRDGRTIRNFPPRVRFGVGAELRSGALLQTSGFLGRKVVDMTAINAYAQFVVKLTVAMLPDSELYANNEANILDPSEGDTRTAVTPVVKIWSWIKDHLTLVVTLLVLLLVVILLFKLPNLGRLLNWLIGLLVPKRKNEP